METYYQRNRDACNKRTREYKKKNKDKVKKWSKTYCEKHKEDISRKNRQRRLDNIEIYKEREKNASKKSAAVRKKAQLKRDYNLTIEEHNNMLIQQDYTCAICGTHQNDLRQNLCIDHNHTTGKIRGLLCHQCNLVLGNALDNIGVLENAIQYLKTSI